MSMLRRGGKEGQWGKGQEHCRFHCNIYTKHTYNLFEHWPVCKIKVRSTHKGIGPVVYYLHWSAGVDLLVMPSKMIIVVR